MESRSKQQDGHSEAAPSQENANPQGRNVTRRTFFRRVLGGASVLGIGLLSKTTVSAQNAAEQGEAPVDPVVDFGAADTHVDMGHQDKAPRKAPHRSAPFGVEEQHTGFLAPTKLSRANAKDVGRTY